MWVFMAQSDMVAHGRAATSSRHITEVKYRWDWLVLEWVTSAQVAADHV